MEDVFALIVFNRTELPEMFATDTFICSSEIFVKETFVLLNKTLVVLDKCVPYTLIVSLAFAIDALKDVIIG